MRLTLVQGDICNVKADAIVNAANSHLIPGGGVCGAIHRAAGPALAELCSKMGVHSAGTAVVTPAFRLPLCSMVIHAIGPVWTDGLQGEEIVLRSAYTTSLNMVSFFQKRTVAFPCISTGIYGFPPDLACHNAIRAVREWDQRNPKQIDEVIFCCFLESDVNVYRKALDIK
jgi:O-acetyl-ADP-ribose deacetylase (regulator of RNase III)